MSLTNLVNGFLVFQCLLHQAWHFASSGWQSWSYAYEYCQNRKVYIFLPCMASLDKLNNEFNLGQFFRTEYNGSWSLGSTQVNWKMVLLWGSMWWLIASLDLPSGYAESTFFFSVCIQLGFCFGHQSYILSLSFRSLSLSLISIFWLDLVSGL